MIYQYGTLQWNIMNHSRITDARKQRVIDILEENGIHDYVDLQKELIPKKGLTANEIRQLSKIKKDLEYITKVTKSFSYGFYSDLQHYTSKHEATRIYNLLKANKIFSERILISVSDEKLSNIPGIGPKSLAVLKKIKEKCLSRSILTARRSTTPASSQPAAMPLLAY